MRLSRPATVLLFATVSALPVLAPGLVQAAPHKKDTAPPAAAAPAAATPPADANPLVATVNGDQIRLDNVRAAARSLPEDMHQLPQQYIFPLIVNQLIDQRALLLEARREKLQDDPAVQKQMQNAADQALQNAYLEKTVGPQITEQAVKDVYAKEYAGKPGEEEVHARHILVPDEKTAQDIIKQLKNGADFATLAKKYSTDKGSLASGDGDLGWFKKGDMVPDFSNAAFAMKKGEISPTPVHTRFGWHVIQVLDTRTSTPPAFDAVRDQIRQKLIQQDVRAVVEKAVSQVKVVRYGPDGKALPAAPPAPAAAAAASGSTVPTSGTAPTPGAPPSGGNP